MNMGLVITAALASTASAAQPPTVANSTPSGPYGAPPMETAEIPPNAHAGQCFARVLVPIKTETYTEQVIDQAEHQETRIRAAVYGWKEKEVVIKEGRTEFVTIPATYKTVTEIVVLREASKRIETRPAVYEAKSEQILVRPAYTTWKRGVGLTGYRVIGQETRVSRGGDILCLIEVPAEYKTVTHQELVKAAETREIEIPAATEAVTHQVIDAPARVEEHKIPAVTKVVKVHSLIEDERAESITAPAIYKTVTKVRVIGGGQVDWREILCDTNTTREVIVRVQTALASRGYFKGLHSGVFGRASWDALVHFQRDNHLPEGQLTMETVKALDISI